MVTPLPPRYILAAVVVFGLVCHGAAQDPSPKADELAAKVTKARQTFKHKLEAAVRELDQTFEEVIKKVAASGDLETVTRLTKEKEEFISSRTLPQSVHMSRHKDNYSNALKAAELEFGDVLKEAKREYTRRLDLTNARIMDQELIQLQAAARNKLNSDDFLKSGTEWKGVQQSTSPRGTTKTPMRIFVRKREAEEITYEHWVDDGRCLLFSGTVKNGQVQARVIELVKGSFSPDTLGAANKSLVRGKKWIHEGKDPRERQYSYLELMLVEEEK